MKLTFENTRISLSDSKNNILKTIKTNFDFKFLHSVRIINSDKCELLIDNVPIIKLQKFEAGRIGYIYKEKGLEYTAYTNSVDTEILKKYPIILPGKVECNYLKDKTFFSDNNIQYIKLKTNESMSFKIIGSKQKLYLSSILDLYDNSIVSYEFSMSNNNILVFKTFDKAIEKNPHAKPIFHSDRGFQYTSKMFKVKLDDQGMIQSMSRVGKCIDNGPMEAFWGTLKSEQYYLNKYYSIEALQQAIEEYIKFYNTQRLQAKLKGLTPIEYRNQALVA
jgi:hypothetical protein